MPAHARRVHLFFPQLERYEIRVINPHIPQDLSPLYTRSVITHRTHEHEAGEQNGGKFVAG